MSQTTLPKRLDPVETAANDILSPEEQARVDAEHGSTGWSAYDVWRTRVFAPKKDDSKTGYNDPRGNS